jgi:hypothetical protein
MWGPGSPGARDVDLDKEPHVVVTSDGQGGERTTPTPGSGWNFHNGSCVGGATPLLSSLWTMPRAR